MTNRRRITKSVIDWLLYGAPDGDSQGEVEVRRFREPDGSYCYTVNQYSGSGGWSSPSTSDLRAADLAAEVLAIKIGAVLLKCTECDRELER